MDADDKDAPPLPYRVYLKRFGSADQNEPIIFSFDTGANWDLSGSTPLPLTTSPVASANVGVQGQPVVVVIGKDKPTEAPDVRDVDDMPSAHIGPSEPGVGSHLQRAPFSGVDDLLQLIFRGDVYRRVMRPALLDAWQDYYEALESGDPAREFAARVRGYFWIIREVASQIVSWVVEIWRSNGND